MCILVVFTTDRYSNSNLEKKKKKPHTHTHTHTHSLAAIGSQFSAIPCLYSMQTPPFIRNNFKHETKK